MNFEAFATLSLYGLNKLTKPEKCKLFFALWAGAIAMFYLPKITLKS